MLIQSIRGEEEERIKFDSDICLDPEHQGLDDPFTAFDDNDDKICQSRCVCLCVFVATMARKGLAGKWRQIYWNFAIVCLITIHGHMPRCVTV